MAHAHICNYFLNDQRDTWSNMRKFNINKLAEPKSENT